MSGAGLDLGTGEYRVEANAFLESRLRLVYAFVLGAAADIYAIGIVAYQLLTGTLPFEAKTAAELIAAHLHADPIPLAQRDASIPGDLAAVVESALAKDPKARPASAAEFADRLRNCADAATA